MTPAGDPEMVTTFRTTHSRMEDPGPRTTHSRPDAPGAEATRSRPDAPGAEATRSRPDAPGAEATRTMFDSIGERPVVKRHKQLSQIGKTKSCGEFKNIERRLIKTYQEENIIKMPSIDSELTNLDISSERGTDLDEVSKARVYEVSETQKKKNVVAWLSKQS
ncbi:hypothetical protein ANCCEY_01198 [Ancylostoma ceylanicum]|uniref:Uncharacterized protein n=1 Tax=Ancylostoma ceylanicum TaxID=53326 RepID=A0A0D6M671_9BILA|nr:hypothetical protein ANCCEY_01198 [Ancylostoma ceylanicum]